jgi:hypothetical protein
MEAGRNRDGSITAAMPPSLSIPAQVPLNRRIFPTLEERTVWDF